MFIKRGTEAGVLVMSLLQDSRSFLMVGASACGTIKPSGFVPGGPPAVSRVLRDHPPRQKEAAVDASKKNPVTVVLEGRTGFVEPSPSLLWLGNWDRERTSHVPHISRHCEGLGWVRLESPDLTHLSSAL